MSKSRVFSVLMVIMFVFVSLTACGGATNQPADQTKAAEASTVKAQEPTKTAEAPKAGKRVGFVAYSYSNPFFVSVREGIKKELESQGYTLVDVDGQADAAKQVSGAESLVAQKVDGIILNPVDGQAIVPVVKKANDAKIPVMTIDQNAGGGDITCFVASDNVLAGKLVGEYLAKRLNGKGNICVTDYPQGSAGRDRTQGFNDAIKGFPDIKIIAQQTSADVTGSAKLADTWIKQFKKIDAYFGINDPSALGFLVAIEAANKQKETFVVGVDGSKEAIDAMKNDRAFGATSAQQPELMGKTTAQKMIEVLKGGTVEKEIKIPVYLINQEDVKAGKVK